MTKANKKLRTVKISDLNGAYIKNMVLENGINKKCHGWQVYLQALTMSRYLSTASITAMAMTASLYTQAAGYINAIRYLTVKNVFSLARRVSFKTEGARAVCVEIHFLWVA